MRTEWSQWEDHVNELLGLRATPASGARWQATGDGVDTDRESVFPLIVDCKATERGSFSLNKKDLRQWVEHAIGLGKRFAMPIRFWNKGSTRSADYILLELNDFVELLEMVRRSGV